MFTVTVLQLELRVRILANSNNSKAYTESVVLLPALILAHIMPTLE